MADADDKVALCVATFYDVLASKLEQGAREALGAAGFSSEDSVVRYEVPGCFELPMIARFAAESGRYVAIRGETDHYDYVCGEAARGIQQVQLLSGVPIGFGVLTVDTMDQALARVTGGTKRDTGAHAVEAALASLAVKKSLQERPQRLGFGA
jgi:6,7-dimethyl-8-ribityllumazine synthase